MPSRRADDYPACPLCDSPMAVRGRRGRSRPDLNGKRFYCERCDFPFVAKYDRSY